VDFNITDIGDFSGIQMGARQIKELLLVCKDLAKEYSRQDCMILRQVQQQI
jgi:hypothetical protein